MKNHKDAKVEIKGYASPEGSKEINEKLSVARAEAVKNILVKRYKISADRLTTKGMGCYRQALRAGRIQPRSYIQRRYKGLIL